MGPALYFIGAGLTKSLELRHRIPMMMDFVPVLADYVDSDVVLNTLVQMELGKVYEAACAACLSLAEKINIDGDIPAAAKAERDRFAALVRNRPPESIEALFERVRSMSPETPESAYAFGLPDLFRYAINQVFSTIRWELQLDPLTRFLAGQFDGDRSAHVFVSFNYDLALDRAVEVASKGAWQPRDGYGFEFPFFTVDEQTACSTEALPRGSREIRILKPHGSLNWLRRRRNRVRQTDSGNDDRYIIPLSGNLELRYWPSSDPFHKISFPGDWPRDVEILIAPPSPGKPSIMPPVRSAECDALSTADEVFVIGYSFPETDDDQRRLIAEALKSRERPVSKLTIINYNATPEYFERIRGLFQPQAARTFNDGFADFSSRGKAFESSLGYLCALEPAS